MFHPISGLAVDLFHNRDMCHGCGWRGAMPMLLPGGTPDYVSRTNFLNWPIPTLYTPAASGHDQGLTQRMDMPGVPSTGLECDTGARGARGIVWLEKRIDP